MKGGLVYSLGPIFVIVFTACAVQAAAPVSPPSSRFVWEPGENLTFTWTNENFDRFYYDPKNSADKESLTIKLDNIEARNIQKYGITYFMTPGQTNTRYRLWKYSVLELGNEKYLAEYPENRSDIRILGDNPVWLHKILIDDNTSQKVENGSRLPLYNGHDIEVRGVNLSDASVLLSLKMDAVDVDSRDLHVGEDFIYEAKDGQIIAVHIDSIMVGDEGDSVLINGIFQTSERFAKNMKGDIFGMMTITDVSDTGITLKNTAGIVELKPGRIIDIGVENLRLKVADSNTLRIILYCDPSMAKNETRGAVHTDLNRLMAWDGLNYAGFMYDINSGNNSESLEITNITGRTIPIGGLIYKSYMDRLTYENYMASVPYAVTKTNDTKPPGEDWSYVTFSLGGNRYIVKNKNPGILTAHGVTYYENKWLGIGQYESKGENWGLGEGYTLMATSANLVEEPRKVRVVLKRNGVELEDMWLKQKDAYIYTQTQENETPKLITYLDNVFAGVIDIFQLRNTWFVSDNVTRIKEGDRLGVFIVMAIEPDRIVLTNMETIELKAGSRINLFGNQGFFVENSDELRFYLTNAEGTIVIREVAKNNVSDIPYLTIPAGTSPVTGITEKISGFEIILPITILLAVSKIGRKRQ